MKSHIDVEVVYALADHQEVIATTVPAGSLAIEAVEHSGIQSVFEDITLNEVTLGIYGKTIPNDHVLSDGDRVEIYRPLLIDPKEARRQKALNAQSNQAKK